ncbi:MAG: response regulator [Acidobacteriota bacterium]
MTRSATQSAAQPETQTKVLVVEAERAEEIAAALSDAGFEALLSNSLEAPSIARREGPRAVILDLDLPDGAGLEALRLLRHEPRLAQVPFLLAGEPTEPHLTLRALQEGAADYLEKPIDPHRLVEHLQNLLAAATADAPQGEALHGLVE